MCGAPHLPIHSSFRSAVFDSACQLRVSIHLGLGAAECPRGRSAPRSLQSSLFHRAPHRSRAARTQYHMRSPPRARPRRAAGSARKPTETARGATTSRNRRPAARARPELPGRSTPAPTSGAGAPGRRHRLARAAGTTNAFNRFKLVHRPAPGSAFAPRAPAARTPVAVQPAAGRPAAAGGPTTPTEAPTLSDGSPRPRQHLWCVVPAQPPWRVGPPRAGARVMYRGRV